jgi:hypothetical protein
MGVVLRLTLFGKVPAVFLMVRYSLWFLLEVVFEFENVKII